MDPAAFAKLESAVCSKIFTQPCKCCDANQLVNQWHLKDHLAFCKKCLPQGICSGDVLQVRRGTPGDVISVGDCESAQIDATGICKLICNKEVIYILPRDQRVSTGKENKVPATINGGTCKKCSAPMHQADALYCSLQCKVCSETSHVPEKACKPAAAKRPCKPAAAKRKQPATADAEPTTSRPKRHRIPSRVAREAALGGPSAPVTAHIPKKRRTAPVPCRISPAVPRDDDEDLEDERQFGAFLLLRAAAAIAHADSQAS